MGAASIAQSQPLVDALLAQPTAPAVHVDAVASLNGQLGSLRDYRIGNSCTNERVGQECRRDETPCFEHQSITIQNMSAISRCIPPKRYCEPIYGRVCREVAGKLSISGDLLVADGPFVTVQEPNWEAIPTQIMGYRETYTNCSPKDQSWSYTHAERWVQGAKETKSASLTIGREQTAGVEISGSYGGLVSGKTSVGIKWSSSSNTTSGQEINLQYENGDSVTRPFAVPAMSRMIAEHYWAKRVVPFAYQGKVVLDAQLAANIEGLTLVSQAIPDVASRTFAFGGVIENSILQEGQTGVVTIPLTEQFCVEYARKMQGQREPVAETFSTISDTFMWGTRGLATE